MPSPGTVAAGAKGYLPQIHSDHAQVLADAALFDDAESFCNGTGDAGGGRQRDRDGLRPAVVAALRLAQGDHDGAQAAAEAAARWYRKQQRVGWTAISTQSLLASGSARDESRTESRRSAREIAAASPDGFGAEATLAGCRQHGSPELATKGRSLSPRCSVDVRSTDEPSTASCSLTSMHSSLNIAATGPPHGGPSVVDSRWQ